LHAVQAVKKPVKVYILLKNAVNGADYTAQNVINALKAAHSLEAEYVLWIAYHANNALISRRANITNGRLGIISANAAFTDFLLILDYSRSQIGSRLLVPLDYAVSVTLSGFFAHAGELAQLVDEPFDTLRLAH
jgi:hypothetical protein